MKIIESDFSKHIQKSVEKELGNIFFLKQIAIIEFNEGVDIDINNSSVIFNELKDYYGISKPFGVIANRVNSYSVKLMDMRLFRKKLNNLSAYAVIGHNTASRMNAEIENNFCVGCKINYDNLYEAINIVYTKVKKKEVSILDQINTI
ncbi:hypothetical protein A8C32_02400 [Flavivirga aquatica]|uniref:Uncharacterized protein n=1 Tax=Flavivirga aquatica TaxID=1849968 RepID=A0A1E5TAB4_9FLAO|nr:hypothetical protein [Flavivirga aquatica]OEK08322.1 hypothetical protein A8C32_02400 [Flavivirga aquatica]